MRTLKKRYVPAALLAGARWILNPVSEGGAKQAPRIKMLIGGPEILARIERMRNDPEGRRILADRPDLGATLTDMPRLGRMPEGSFGRAFHDYMAHPDGIPGYLLAGLVYRDGFLDGYALSDEERYFVERNLWDHDMEHVLTGYGADLAGEGLLLHFNLGYLADLSYRAGLLSPFGFAPRFLLRPSVGMKRWSELLRDANARGRRARATRPPECVYWEEWLERPLDEVRRALGFEAWTEDTSEWLAQSVVGRHAAGGFGLYERQLEKAKLAREAVESGVPYRDLLRASPKAAAKASRIAKEGASVDEVIATLRASA